LLAPFLAKHPQVDIELILDDRMVDLVKEASISCARARPAAGRHCAAGRGIATPTGRRAILPAHGKPRKPQDLARFDYIRFAWLADGDVLTLHRAN
jgi:DNA-binding transcriptional LysR family regulator